MKTIILTFHEGTTTVEAAGFKGKGCQDATKQIEAALGLVKNVQKKPEFNQVGTVQTSQTQHQSH